MKLNKIYKNKAFFQTVLIGCLTFGSISGAFGFERKFGIPIRVSTKTEQPVTLRCHEVDNFSRESVSHVSVTAVKGGGVSVAELPVDGKFLSMITCYINGRSVTGLFGLPAGFAYFEGDSIELQINEAAAREGGTPPAHDVILTIGIKKIAKSLGVI